MIVKEFYAQRKDGVNLYHIYSDINHYIIQHPAEIEYVDVIDIENAPYTYTESDKEIKSVLDI